MIPKIIHYCWFGRNPLPESAQKCIASWRNFLPDYEIWQWSEESLHDNANVNDHRLYNKIMSFDVNIIPYTQQAYEVKKYAFVSDYARFWILYHYGGLYFDTDVEVIKSFDEIVEKGSFMGMEIDGTTPASNIAINPGLGMGAIAKLPIYEKIINSFKSMKFYDSDGTFCNYTMIPLVTDIFCKEGLVANGEKQQIDSIVIYPPCYFNPLDDATGRLRITNNTYSIHWYAKTWMTRNPHWLVVIKRYLRRVMLIK